jgi:hypothetical protein
MWLDKESVLGSSDPLKSESRFISSKRSRLSISSGAGSPDQLKRCKAVAPPSLQDVDPDSEVSEAILLLQQDIADVSELVRQVEREHMELESEFENFAGGKSVDTTASEE